MRLVGIANDHRAFRTDNGTAYRSPAESRSSTAIGEILSIDNMAIIHLDRQIVYRGC
jgi:hypothetical protein